MNLETLSIIIITACVTAGIVLPIAYLLGRVLAADPVNEDTYDVRPEAMTISIYHNPDTAKPSDPYYYRLIGGGNGYLLTEEAMQVGRQRYIKHFGPGLVESAEQNYKDLEEIRQKARETVYSVTYDSKGNTQKLQ